MLGVFAVFALVDLNTVAAVADGDRSHHCPLLHNGCTAVTRSNPPGKAASVRSALSRYQPRLRHEQVRIVNTANRHFDTFIQPNTSNSNSWLRARRKSVLTCVRFSNHRAIA